MRRIAVIGNIGGGKTMLSRAVSRQLGLPMYELDTLLWRRGWDHIPYAEFEEAQRHILDEPAWVIDGFASFDFLERTLARADTVVFVDLALWQHYWGATRRQIECLFRPREGFPTNCPMYQKALATVPRIRAIHRRGRPRFLELTALAERRGKRFVHLKTRGEMKRELARVARLAGRRPAS